MMTAVVKYQMPPLPENQRWVVGGSMGFVIVKLQERRRWIGWRTIGKSLESANLGGEGVRRCVDSIQNREYYAKMRREREAEARRRRGTIPYGVTRGGG